MALSNAPTGSIINENWLFDFSADNTNCLDFDGTDDFLSWGDIFDTPFANFTIEFWILADGNASGPIVSFNSTDSSNDEQHNVSFLAKKLTSGEFRLFYEYSASNNEDNQTSGFNMPDDAWHHVAIVRDDSTDEAHFYLDGVLTETEDAQNDPTGGTSTSHVLRIGCNTAGTEFFNGKLAHVRIWDVARTSAEVAHFYNRLVDSTASGLQGYWKFDEGHGTTVTDYSSNSNEGTINGASWLLNGFTERIHAFGLSFNNTIVDNIKYHGNVINKNIVLRDSIDITRGTSSTGNITLQCANINIYNTNLYKIVFNGTNNYLNKEVHVYAQYNYETSLASCQRIFTGKLVDINVDQNQILTLQINSHRPWDKIEIPQTKHTQKHIYEPVVYGSFNFVDFSTTPIDAAYGGLYPVPVINVSQGSATSGSTTHDGTIDTLMPRSFSSNDNNFLHFHLDDYFLGITKQPGIYDRQESTVSEFGVNVLKTLIANFAHGNIIPSLGSNQWGVTMMSNMERAFVRDVNGDVDMTGFASQTISTVGDTAYIQLKSFSKLFSNSQIYSVRVTLEADRNDGEKDSADDQTYDVTIFKNGSTLSANQVYTEESAIIDTSPNGSTDAYDITNTDAPTELQCKFESQATAGAGTFTFSAHKLKIYGIKVKAVIDLHDSDQEDVKALSNMKYMYCGGPGLTESWSGGNTAIAWGIEAFRDLLIRFAGHHRTAPTGWTALYYDRRTNSSGTDQNNWKIRYWQLEPASLKEKLDKMAYEFGFVYKFSADGTLKMIHVVKSSEMSATVDLNNTDLKNIKISTTGLSEVITKMSINNHLHPAVSGKYYRSVTATNTNARKKYNHGEKENIANINLDMNVGTIPETAASDCNDDFFSYYNNIIGDIKVIVTCDIVNMAKGAQLETGDIITFSSMPVEMFGTDFSASKFFMVIETKRSLGKVSIVAREVG